MYPFFWTYLFQRSWQYLSLLTTSVIICALLFPIYFLINRETDSPYQKNTQEEALWLCSPFRSLDGMLVLDFVEGNKINLESYEDKTGQKDDGEWQVTNKKVVINMKNHNYVYRFIHDEDEEHCLLFNNIKNKQILFGPYDDSIQPAINSINLE